MSDVALYNDELKALEDEMSDVLRRAAVQQPVIQRNAVRTKAEELFRRLNKTFHQFKVEVRMLEGSDQSVYEKIAASHGVAISRLKGGLAVLTTAVITVPAPCGAAADAESALSVRSRIVKLQQDTAASVARITHMLGEGSEKAVAVSGLLGDEALERAFIVAENELPRMTGLLLQNPPTTVVAPRAAPIQHPMPAPANPPPAPPRAPLYSAVIFLVDGSQNSDGVFRRRVLVTSNRTGASYTLQGDVARDHNLLSAESLDFLSIKDEGSVAFALFLLEQNFSLLRTLDLSHNAIRSRAIDLGQILSVNTNLTSLNLNDNNIHDDGVVAIAQGLSKNKTLRYLSCQGTGGNTMTSKGLDALHEAVQANTTLLRLDISNLLSSFVLTTKKDDSLKVKECEEFIQRNNKARRSQCAAAVERIQRLLVQLPCCDEQGARHEIEDEEHALRARLDREHARVELGMRTSAISRNGRKLFVVDLESNSLTISEVAPCRRMLHRITFPTPLPSDVDVRFLPGLIEGCRARTNTEKRTIVAYAIFLIEWSAPVSAMDLSGLDIGGSELAELAAALGHSQCLRKLNLSGNNIDNESFVMFARVTLSTNASLTALEIRGNRFRRGGVTIAQSGIRALISALTANHSLLQLDMRHTSRLVKDEVLTISSLLQRNCHLPGAARLRDGDWVFLGTGRLFEKRVVYRALDFALVSTLDLECELRLELSACRNKEFATILAAAEADTRRTILLGAGTQQREAAPTNDTNDTLTEKQQVAGDHRFTVLEHYELTVMDLQNQLALQQLERDAAVRRLREVEEGAARARAAEEHHRTAEAAECVICMEGRQTHACVPCGHRVLCSQCASVSIARCPVCRAFVKDIIRVFT